VKQTVTVDEAAEILKVSRRTVYYMIQRGELHLVESSTESRTKRIDMTELLSVRRAK
jgi:excisionase family DNA binding protein